MVLELKVPHGALISDLKPVLPFFLSYVLSFIYIVIYWHNHHHLFQTVHHVTGRILWANTNLLFWLSLIPFATAWSAENQFSEIPVAIYGLILFMSAVAYYILTNMIISGHGEESPLALAIKKDIKGKLSVFLYAIAIPLSVYNSWIGILIYIAVAIIWIVPDSRIEKFMGNLEKDN